MTTKIAFFLLKNAYEIQIMVIKCKQQWLDSGTQSPPQELHHERLSAISDRRGKGWGENLQWCEQENRVTGMLKKIDSEDLKMMQLLNHDVTTLDLNKFTWQVKFSPLIFEWRMKKKIKQSLILSLPTLFFGVNREILMNSHFQVLKAFASFLFSIKVNHLLQNHGVLAKLHHWGGWKHIAHG